MHSRQTTDRQMFPPHNLLIPSQKLTWTLAKAWKMVFLQHPCVFGVGSMWSVRRTGSGSGPVVDRPLGACQAVIAKSEDLQKAFGTVDLAEHLGGTRWVLESHRSSLRSDSKST